MSCRYISIKKYNNFYYAMIFSGSTNIKRKRLNFVNIENTIVLFPLFFNFILIIFFDVSLDYTRVNSLILIGSLVSRWKVIKFMIFIYLMLTCYKRRIPNKTNLLCE